MAYPRGNTAESERPAEAPLKVLIADDHPLILTGIRRTLEASEDIEIVGEARSGPEVLALVERRRPAVVLLDLRMPGVEGEQCISQIRERWPEVKVVVLSACDDAHSVQSALAAGASAYVLKSVKPVDIAAVLRQAAGGGAIFHAPLADGGRTNGETASAAPALTDRETSILRALAGGLTTRSISGELWISEHTVKFHLTNIYRKLGVSNRASAVRYAIENGLATFADTGSRSVR